jgi:hydrogenase expression/formation protein HypE
MSTPPDFQPVCPLPLAHYPNILMAHGGGGRLMHDLIELVFKPPFNNPLLAQGHDGALIETGGARLAFTTDSYVVKPLFFPGGDIGKLAICGTVNDLAMCGARPLALSAGFILEEGLPMETLQRVVRSMGATAQAAGVPIATGDTKVVDRGQGDGLFINTAGIGLVPAGLTIGPAYVQPGDAILLNGDVGRHGTCIMAGREGLAFDTDLQSDCAPLTGVVQKLIAGGIQVHCLRDCTRGGLATTLVEIARARGLRIHLDSAAIPVRDDVRGACEMLGLDPLYVANEGRFIAIVPADQADHALTLMREDEQGAGAVRIGAVLDEKPGLLTLRSEIGSTRILDMLSGEQLPRIC